MSNPSNNFSTEHLGDAERMQANILDAVKNFVSERNSDYAFMLSGPWGIGKSYFWRHCVEEELRREANNVIVYVSLYGVRSTREINNELAARIPLALTKVQPSQQGLVAFLSLGKRVVGGMTAKVLDKLGIDAKLVDSTLPELIRSLSSIRQFILCFDDLERALLPIEETFGLINRFIENCHSKVFLIANEEMLISQHQDKYLSTKEKLVRITRVVPQPSHATLLAVAQTTAIDPARSFILSHIESISKYFDQSKTPNLRSFRFALSCLQNSFLSLQEEGVRPNHTLINSLYPAAQDYHLGTLRREGIQIVLSDRPFGWTQPPKSESKEKSPAQEAAEHFRTYHSHRHDSDLLFLPSLADVVTEGAIDTLSLRNDLTKKREQEADSQSALRRISHNPYLLEDSEFSQLVADAKKELGEGKITDFRVMIEAVNALSRIGEEQMANISQDEIKVLIDECLNAVAQRFPLDRAVIVRDIERPFASELSDIANELLEEIKRRSRDTVSSLMTSQLDQAIKRFRTNPSELARLITDDELLGRTPLQLLMNEQVLEKTIASSTNEGLGYLNSALATRYRQPYLVVEDQMLLESLLKFTEIQLQSATQHGLRRYWLKQLLGTLREKVMLVPKPISQHGDLSELGSDN